MIFPRAVLKRMTVVWNLSIKNVLCQSVIMSTLLVNVNKYMNIIKGKKENRCKNLSYRMHMIRILRVYHS